MFTLRGQVLSKEWDLSTVIQGVERDQNLFTGPVVIEMFKVTGEQITQRGKDGPRPSLGAH